MPDTAQEALVMATTAMSRIGSHELECARRYGEVAARFDGVDGKLDEWREAADRRFRQQVWGAVSIIATVLLTTIVQLALRHFT